MILLWLSIWFNPPDSYWQINIILRRMHSRDIVPSYDGKVPSGFDGLTRQARA